VPEKSGFSCAKAVAWAATHTSAATPIHRSDPLVLILITPVLLLEAL
jgi:hypothetical protein